MFKNVSLRRDHPNERLGLTLCYGIASNSTTNIYIQQVTITFHSLLSFDDEYIYIK